MTTADFSLRVSENIMLAILDKLAAGDSSPSRAETDAEVGRRLEALRLTLNGQTGRAQKIAELLKIGLVEEFENYNASYLQTKAFEVVDNQSEV